MIWINRIEPDHFAGQVETEYLLAAVSVEHSGLYCAAPNREDRTEWIAGTEDVLTGVVRPDVFDQALQRSQFRLLIAG
jgi:hypothetical protein